MDNRMYIKEENILVRPLPLMSKGESDLVWWLPSSPKGEIVGIMIQVLSLMATHSEVGTGDGNLIRRQILVQHAKEVHIRMFVKPKSRVHASWIQKKRVYVEKYLWSMVVSPWKLCLWFRTIVSRRACRSLVLKLMVLCYYGFGSWY